MTAQEKLRGQEERPKLLHRPCAFPPFNDSTPKPRRLALPHMLVAKKVVLLLFLVATVEAFSCVSSHDGRKYTPSSRRMPSRLVVIPQETKATFPLRMREERSDSPVPRFVSLLNSSTKWLVTLGNVVALWSRPRNVFGPFIIAGVILATYLTALLKRLIDQGRPDGSPFSDPGMPSSHALSSFFLANCWRQTYQGNVGPWLWSAAAAVASLRVMCGFHTLAQIAVGAVLGVSLGHGWMTAGRWLSTTYPVWTFRVVWLAYVSLSLLFLRSTMSKWTQEDRHL